MQDQEGSQNVIRKTYSLRPDQIKYVEMLAADKHGENDSRALRQIIDFHMTMSAAQLPLPMGEGR